VFYTRLVEDLEDLNSVLLKTQSLKDHFACSSGKGYGSCIKWMKNVG
jgi:hypothetical protein